MTATTICSWLLGVSLLSLLVACHDDLSRPAAHMHTSAGAPPQQSRGEAVFRLQNSVMDQLLAAQLLAGAADGTAERSFAECEARLVEQCARLNEAANLSATGGTASVMLRPGVLVSLPGCEQSALAASDFLIRAPHFVGAALP